MDTEAGHLPGLSFLSDGPNPSVMQAVDSPNGDLPILRTVDRGGGRLML